MSLSSTSSTTTSIAPTVVISKSEAFDDDKSETSDDNDNVNDNVNTVSNDNDDHDDTIPLRCINSFMTYIHGEDHHNHHDDQITMITYRRSKTNLQLLSSRESVQYVFRPSKGCKYGTKLSICFPDTKYPILVSGLDSLDQVVELSIHGNNFICESLHFVRDFTVSGDWTAPKHSKVVLPKVMPNVLSFTMNTLFTISTIPELPKCKTVRISKCSLKTLPKCAFPNIQNLKITNTDLESLNDNHVSIKTNLVDEVDLQHNKLTELPYRMTCKSLIVNNNELTILPSLPFCTVLVCHHNKIKEINKDLQQRLVHLNANNNHLTKLSDMPRVSYIQVDNNQLTTMANRYPQCKTFIVNGNKLTQLPQLPKCRQVVAYWNNIKIVDLDKQLPVCDTLYIANNQLEVPLVESQSHWRSRMSNGNADASVATPTEMYICQYGNPRWLSTLGWSTESNIDKADFGYMKIFKSDDCVICLTPFTQTKEAKLLMTCGHLCCHLKCAVQVCPVCRKGKPFKQVG